MRFFTFSYLFRVVVTASFPGGPLNRLSLHVMGLSPNSRSHHGDVSGLSSSISDSSSSCSGCSSSIIDGCTTDDKSVLDEKVAQCLAPESMTSCTTSSTTPISPAAVNNNQKSHKRLFPFNSLFWDKRGGSTMHPVEDISAVKTNSAAPLEIFGFGLSLFGVKLLLQLGLTLLNVVCWWLPMRNKSFSQNENLMALANTFSAGIFLMLAFSHLIPHSLHTLEAANINPMYAFQATLVGYLVIFAIEKLLFDSHTIVQEVMEPSSPIRRPSLSVDTAAQPYFRRSLSGNNSTDDNEVQHTRPRAPSIISQQSAVVLLLAMSVHSLFETVALGLAPDRTSSIILASSIALHQPAESLALLVAFLKTSMERKEIIRWLSLFSILGPIGVLLGRIIQTHSSPLIEGLLIAMTAGTFLFVSTTEIIPEAFENEVPYREKWKRFASLVGGIGSIMLIGGGDDDHHH